MKYTAMLSLLALPFSLFADGEVADTMMSDQKNMKPMSPAQVTLTSARPESANG